LKPIPELRKYIQKNKHLPDISSTSQVVTNGINIVDMNVKLLEKVEEFHLYIIQQQQRIDELKKFIR
jgi:hypothetical protein